MSIMKGGLERLFPIVIIAICAEFGFKINVCNRKFLHFQSSRLEFTLRHSPERDIWKLVLVDLCLYRALRDWFSLQFKLFWYISLLFCICTNKILVDIELFYWLSYNVVWRLKIRFTVIYWLKVFRRKLVNFLSPWILFLFRKGMMSDFLLLRKNLLATSVFAHSLLKFVRSTTNVRKLNLIRSYFVYFLYLEILFYIDFCMFERAVTTSFRTFIFRTLLTRVTIALQKPCILSLFLVFLFYSVNLRVFNGFTEHFGLK